mmetsp:Transcript_18705/g.45154  ORF Transcript_18705/g.45154 Transcript_18705/m.45154 type:complete len:249 (+) Transcript_18705:109-855(+)
MSRMETKQPSSTATMSLTVRRRINTYDRLASRHGWTKVQIKSESDIRVWRQRYKRVVVGNSNSTSIVDQQQEFVVLDLWPTTGTVGSYLRHPKQNKKTQLFRKECTDEGLLEQIFQDPRTHTDKGYHRRSNQPPSQYMKNENDAEDDDLDRKRTRPVAVVEENDARIMNNEQDEDGRQHKRRRLACSDGQDCRNWNCPYSHSPRCFFGARCWFQPNCWFDHTHGLCQFGEDCVRDGCWFSHRNPHFYY